MSLYYVTELEKIGRNRGVHQKIKPNPVMCRRISAGLSDVVGSFTDYVQSTRDRDGRVSDINRPLKNLMVASKQNN